MTSGDLPNFVRELSICFLRSYPEFKVCGTRVCRRAFVDRYESRLLPGCGGIGEVHGIGTAGHGPAGQMAEC